MKTQTKVYLGYLGLVVLTSVGVFLVGYLGLDGPLWASLTVAFFYLIGLGGVVLYHWNSSEDEDEDE